MFLALYILVMLACVACMLAGWVWILIIAGREDAMCVVLCIFCPFYIFYYIFTRLEQTGIPAAMYFIPWLLIMGTSVLGAVLQAQGKSAPVASASQSEPAIPVSSTPTPTPPESATSAPAEAAPPTLDPVPAADVASAAVAPPELAAATPLPETPQTSAPLATVPATDPVSTPAEPSFPPGLIGDAQRSYHEGRFADGNSYLQAALLTSDDKALWDQVRWCPALGRPVAGVRWGIGLQIPDNVPLRSATSPQGNVPPAGGDDNAGAVPGAARANDAVPAEVREVTGDIGAQVLAALPVAQLSGLLGPLPAGARSHGGVQYVGKGPDAREVLSLARQTGVDVLVLAAVTVKVQGINRNVDASLSIRLVDVATDKRLWTSTTLSSSQARMAASKGQNPGGELVRSLNEYLETNFQLQPRPSLDKDKIRLRAEAVAREEPVNPLPALMEVRYYQRLGLLTSLQAEMCYQRLIDADDGEKMANGSDADRRRAIDRYLPQARRN